MTSVALTERTDRPGRIQFSDVVASEWTKLRSLRSTRWAFVAYVALSIGMTVLVTALTAANWDHASASDRHDALADPIGLILQPGGVWGQIAICVLGVLLFAGEYSSGTIRASLLAVPRRTPVLAAKAAVFAAVTFAVAEVVAFTSFFIGRTIIAKHVPVSLGDPGVLRAVVGTGLALAVIGLFAMSLGVLVRHLAGAITLTIGIVTVLPTVLSGVPGRLGDYLKTYVPGGNAIGEIMSSGHNPDSVVSPWQGFAIACGWSAVALALATVALRRRDV
jgi:ABC-type transport system involved in multi-copper enzyme maturation permease subunit